MVEASSATTGVSRTPSTKVKPLPVVLDTTVNASEIVVVPTAKAVTVVFPKVEVPVTPTVPEKVAAAAKLAVEGVARKVATPVPNPDTPVLIGRPVALVRVAADGVPRFGVVKTGETAKTAAPVPVSSVSSVANSEEVSISVPKITAVSR